MPVTYYTSPSPASVFGAMRQFGARGGFINGLNPTMIGRIWYVRGEGTNSESIGADSNSGRQPDQSFATMARALANVDSYDIIVMDGVFREQVVAPLGVLDVTIRSAANQPRQATNNGVPTGGGASWLAPASPVASTPLIRLIEQGWSIYNIQMAPVAASACITFDRRETAILPDSSHGTVQGCYFSTGGSGGMGVEIIECTKIAILDNLFQALTGAGGYAIKGTAGLGVAAPSFAHIRNNSFVLNTNDISFVSNYGLIEENTFYSTNPIEAGIRIKLDGSTGRNRVLNNNFSDVAADVTPAKGYTPATGDVWRNWTSDTNVPIVTVPS